MVFEVRTDIALGREIDCKEAEEKFLGDNLILVVVPQVYGFVKILQYLRCVHFMQCKLYRIK